MQKTQLNVMEAGNTYQTILLVSEIIEKTTKTGQPFCTFALQDGMTQVNANLFSGAAPSTMEANKQYLKSICEVSLEVSLYNGATSYQIKKIAKAAEGTYNLGDFIKKAPKDGDVMFNKIIEVLNTCTSPIKNIAINLYNQNKEKLLYWSAAKTMHHNYYAGLLYHTFRMLSHATVAVSIYKNLNRDLLVTGVVLHDIGKLKELETDTMGITEYTVDGNLFGHLLIGIEMINEEVAKNPQAYNEEEVRLLKHMIASHHQRQEYGAVKVPSTMEAVALAYIDDMDAKMEMCDSLLQNMKPGECMDKNDLGLGTKLYKPNL